MAQATETAREAFETVADVLERLGDIPPERVLARPALGTATEEDLLEVLAHSDRLVELVEGTLVEKAMGYYEGALAAALIGFLQIYLSRNNLGLVAGADATLRLVPGLVRLPDVSFIAWDRLPTDEQLKSRPILALAPDLAVEVLSRSNTRREMERKLREYFEAGSRLVWYVDPRARTVTVYTAPDRSEVLGEDRTLDGGDLLSGFALPVRELFERANRPG